MQQARCTQWSQVEAFLRRLYPDTSTTAATSGHEAKASADTSGAASSSSGTKPTRAAKRPFRVVVKPLQRCDDRDTDSMLTLLVSQRGLRRRDPDSGPPHLSILRADLLTRLVLQSREELKAVFSKMINTTNALGESSAQAVANAHYSLHGLGRQREQRGAGPGVSRGP